MAAVRGRVWYGKRLAVPTQALLDSNDLAWERWGLRFSHPAVEDDYQRWSIIHSLPFNRIGMIAAFAAWTGSIVAFYFGLPEAFAAVAAWVLLLMYPAMLGTIAITYSGQLQRWTMPATAITNSISGFLTIWLTMGLGGSTAVTSGAVTLSAYFGLTIFRLPPRLALLAVAPYVLLAEYLALKTYLAGQIAQLEFAGFIFVPLTALLTGAVVCAALERIARETYRNERIIERQRRALLEERANLSKFLSPEVTRMVRERGIEATLIQQTLTLSAVCCDLRGFTAYTEKHGAQQMAAVLREYYETVVEVAKRYGGTVKDFAGDGALILVGAPLPRPDHAQAGLALARELLVAVTALTTRFSTPAATLGVGIGIATGACAVGAIGSQNRLEYTAVGSAVNLASRLCARATHGQILICPDIAKLVAAGASWREQPIQLKGFDQPLRVMIESI